MIDKISLYLSSVDFFMDLLLSACISSAFFYFLPRVILSVFRGNITTRAGVFQFNSNKLYFLLIVLGNIALFVVMAFGAFVILRTKYNIV